MKKTTALLLLSTCVLVSGCSKIIEPRNTGIKINQMPDKGDSIGEHRHRPDLLGVTF